MNKPASLLPAIGLLGGVCACLLAFPAAGLTQQPDSVPATVDTPNNENKANEPGVPANDTEIFATQGATFAAKDRIAVFKGNVRVKDPRFVLACDTLTVYLAKNAMSGTSATPTPAETPAKTADPNPAATPRGGGIDHALAEGHVTIIQKRAPTKPGEEEKVSVGKADIVEFDNKTGDTTLRGLPRVEQNGNIHEALSRSTVMTLSSDNSLKTVGPSRTIIEPHGNNNLPGGSPAAKTGAVTPGASPAARRTAAGGTQN